MCLIAPLDYGRVTRGEGMLLYWRSLRCWCGGHGGNKTHDLSLPTFDYIIPNSKQASKWQPPEKVSFENARRKHLRKSKVDQIQLNQEVAGSTLSRDKSSKYSSKSGQYICCVQKWFTEQLGTKLGKLETISNNNSKPGSVNLRRVSNQT